MICVRGLLPAALAMAAIPLLVTEARGAGFHLYEKSVQAGGRTFAGVSAATDDTGIIAFNPAGMTELEGPSGGAGGFAVIPHAEIDDTGSNLSVGPVGPLPVSGDPHGQGFKAQPSAYLYGAMPLNDRLWFGLSFNVPFGLKADYDEDFFGRYDSIKSSLVVMEFAPSLAYRFNDQVSVGGSLHVQRADAKLTNALPNPLDPNGPNPASDGLFTVEGNDWSVGFMLGLHVRPTERLEIGLTYRKSPTHTLTGTGTTDFAGAETVIGARADLNLPDVISFGARYKATERLSLLAEVNHFGWNDFEELRIEFDDMPDAVTPEDFKNTWGLALGGEYALNEVVALRTGILYEKTPTRDAHRSTRIPDTDRLWLGVGASYEFTQGWSVDVSYMHLFSNSAPVNRENTFPALGTSVQTLATTRTSSNVLGLGVQARF